VIRWDVQNYTSSKAGKVYFAIMFACRKDCAKKSMDTKMQAEKLNVYHANKVWIWMGIECVVIIVWYREGMGRDKSKDMFNSVNYTFNYETNERMPLSLSPAPGSQINLDIKTRLLSCSVELSWFYIQLLMSLACNWQCTKVLRRYFRRHSSSSLNWGNDQAILTFEMSYSTCRIV